MVLDLAKNLGEHFGIAWEVANTYTLRDKIEQNPRALFIALNMESAALIVPAKNIVTAGIQNDLPYRYVSQCDVMFNPSFHPFQFWGEQKKPQLTYDIHTLPTRITQEAAPKKNDAAPNIPVSADVETSLFFSEKDWAIIDALPAKPVVVIVIRSAGPDNLLHMADICKQLNEKHGGVRFLISTGPASYAGTTADVKHAFHDLDDVHIYSWFKHSGEDNPYLSMIARADCVVTTGTISTTSDLVRSGKPIFYLPYAYSDKQRLTEKRHPALDEKLCPDTSFMARHFADGLVDIFDATALDPARNDQTVKIREEAAKAWDKIGAQFVIDIRTRLQAFDPACHCMTAAKSQPVPPPEARRKTRNRKRLASPLPKQN